MSGLRGLSMPDRFWAKVKETPSCWIWTASQDNHGYGQFMVWVAANKCKPMKAYRVAYELMRAMEVPDGMTLDHLCRNRLCVNPDHLEVVTRGENVSRGGNSLVTHCPHGHPYSQENTRYWTK